MLKFSPHFKSYVVNCNFPYAEGHFEVNLLAPQPELVFTFADGREPLSIPIPGNAILVYNAVTYEVVYIFNAGEGRISFYQNDTNNEVYLDQNLVLTGRRSDGRFRWVKAANIIIPPDILYRLMSQREERDRQLALATRQREELLKAELRRQQLVNDIASVVRPTVKTWPQIQAYARSLGIDTFSPGYNKKWLLREIKRRENQQAKKGRASAA